MPKLSRKPLKSAPRAKSDASTVIWGSEIEQGDYIKVPRALLMLRMYADTKKYDLQPRHFFLLLVLASEKFKDHPIRKYWEELADKTGFKRNTIRNWAYELEEMGLLKMKRHRGRDPVNGKVGIRNERNEFFLDGFVELLQEAHSKHVKRRKSRRKRGKDSTNG